MNNFISFFRNAYFINCKILKYAILANPSADIEIQRSYEYIRCIRKGFWKSFFHTGNTQNFTVSLAKFTCIVDEKLFSTIAESCNFSVVEYKSNDFEVEFLLKSTN